MTDANKYLVMLSSSGRGGIRSVVEAYQRDGVFARWNVKELYPHVEGSLLRRLAAAARALVQFFWLLVRGRVRMLHAHAAMKGSFWRKALFSELARLFNVPVVLHLHGSGMAVFHDSLGQFARRQFRRQLEKANCVLVLSESWREFASAAAPRAKIEVLVNYVTVPHESDCAKLHDGLRVLFLGLLGRRKGIYDLLPAFGKAAEEIPEMCLFIGGNGEITEANQAIKALGLNKHVEMLGWVAGADKNAQLAIADIFVLPSYNEGMPISLLEAMSYKIPVISTHVGGIPELVRDNQDGCLIIAGDQSALTDRLLRLAKDPSLRRQMGTSGRQRVVDEYSDLSVLPRLEAIYRRLVDTDENTETGSTRLPRKEWDQR